MAKRAQLDEVRPALDAVNDKLNTAEKFLDSIESGADKATDILESGLEKVADVIPETLDKSVYVAAEGTRKGVRAFGNPKVMAISLVAGGAVLGAGIGFGAYFLLKKKIETKLRAEFQEKADEEVEKSRLFYQKQFKTGKYASPEAAAEELKVVVPSAEDQAVRAAVEALDEYAGIEETPDDPRLGANNRVRYDKVKTNVVVPDAVVPDEAVAVTAVDAVVERNVFVQASVIENWDQDAEEASRHPESPYVISHDEFLEDAYEHTQSSISFYRVEDILADEQEQMIEDVEATVGVENLSRFGHGSRDASTVYIRNERLEMDFEVVLNEGSYMEEVMGLGGRRGDGG